MSIVYVLNLLYLQVLFLLSLENLILILMQFLKPMFLLKMGFSLFLVIHAASRKVPIEISRYKPRKVIASDGFVKYDDGEETLVFHHDSDSKSACMKNSSKSFPGVIKRTNTPKQLDLQFAGGVRSNVLTTLSIALLIIFIQVTKNKLFYISWALGITPSPRSLHLLLGH